MNDMKLLTVIIVVLSLISCSGPENSIKLSELDLAKMGSGWGTARQDSSVTGSILSVAGKHFESGIGTHAISTFLIRLDKKGKRFSCLTGVDDGSDNSQGSVEFIIVGDQKVLWQSGIMKKGDSARKADVDIRGIEKLGLLVTDAGDGKNNDHADWVDGVITYKKEQPQSIDNKYIIEREEILTPPSPSEPRINGAKIYGAHPGSPFLYRIPATGKRPITFTASGLPEGLSLDQNSGVISGTTGTAGEYAVVIAAQNSFGSDERTLKIIAGDKLALTPPMGWNSWYIYYHRVSDSVMRLSADLMISSGMADYGYQYVNIDDCWAIKAGSDDPVIGGEMRGKNGELRTNKLFPDMKGLTDYIHGKGLKAGIYISPGPTTCAGYTGSYQHEQQDIRTFAEWGFDFLKYDWCSYGRIEKERTREAYIKPYKLMWDELQKIDRDIVLNLCQYGMGNVWEWGAEVGNCWRTTGDLGLVAGSSMPGFWYVGLSNSQHWEYAQPGGWNDPDYILIGWIRNALKKEMYQKADMTPNEQYAYMSMWSMMAAPLIYGGEMARLDAFTLNVLCNNEVIDVNQDILGKQAKIIRATKEELVMVKELEGGSYAVGLFSVSGDANTTVTDLVDEEANGLSDAKRELTDAADSFVWDEIPSPAKMTISASDLNISGKFSVRDLWRQKDLGIFENSFTTEVPFHGVKLLRINEVE